MRAGRWAARSRRTRGTAEAKAARAPQAGGQTTGAGSTAARNWPAQAEEAGARASPATQAASQRRTQRGRPEAEGRRADCATGEWPATPVPRPGWPPQNRSSCRPLRPQPSADLRHGGQQRRPVQSPRTPPPRPRRPRGPGSWPRAGGCGPPLQGPRGAPAARRGQRPPRPQARRARARRQPRTAEQRRDPRRAPPMLPRALAPGQRRAVPWMHGRASLPKSLPAGGRPRPGAPASRPSCRRQGARAKCAQLPPPAVS